MRVLVTGATGFLGSHLCRRLAEEGHEITAFRRASSNSALLDALNLNQVTGDILDEESLSCAAEGQELVIHAAAHLIYWRRLQETQTEINVQGTRNVISACKLRGVRRLLYVSSAATIGVPDDKNSPADEAFAFNLWQSGLNYPISKRQAEDEVIEASKDGLDAVVVNPSSIFGPASDQFRGAEFVEHVRQKRLVTYFVGGRNVVHVADVVDGVLAAAELGRTGERYILGGENITYRQMAETSARRLGLRRLFIPIYSPLTGAAALATESLSEVTGKRPFITYDAHFLASRHQYYDSSKAKRELGFRARTFADILEEYLTRTQV